MGFFTEPINFFNCNGMTAMAGWPGLLAMGNFNGSAGSITVVDVPSGEVVAFVSTGSAYPVQMVLYDATLLGVFLSDGSGRTWTIGSSFPSSSTSAYLPYSNGTSLQKSQTYANDYTNGQGLARSSSGKAVQLNYLGTAAQITLSGATLINPFNCIAYDGSANYYIGGADGNIYQMNFAGAISNTTTLPTTPNCGTAPNLRATAMSIFTNTSGSSFLVVATTQGPIFTYDITSGTPSLVDTNFAGFSNSNYGLTYSLAVNHGLILAGFEGPGQFGTYALLMDYGTEPFMQMDELSLDTTTNIIDLYLDTSIGAACIGTQNGILVFGCNGLVPTTAFTRCINSGDADVAQRVYRICNPKEFRGRVEVDATVVAGLQPLTSRFQNVGYTEISSSISATGTFTGTTTSGSAVITTSSTSGLSVGTAVSGTGIPSGSAIISIVLNTSVTISNNATSNNTSESISYSTEQLDVRRYP